MLDKKEVIGTSHAKIIVIGEHSVVYGQPAIALPLSAVGITVKVASGKEDGPVIKSSYYTGKVRDLPQRMLGTKQLLEELLRGVPENQKQIEISIQSTIPAERGMGSSAAVAIAIVRAIFRFYGWHLSEQQLLNLANISEIETHNNPSGLDAATAASSSPVWMIRDKEIKSIPINNSGYLLICDSGILGQTKEAIQIVRNKLDQDHETATALLYDLGMLTKKVKQYLSQNQLEKLGNAFKSAQTDLKSLGVSLPQIDKLIEISYKNGSLGSKITGGGRGGCFFCLLPTRKKAEKLAKIMKTHGVTQTWIEPLSARKE